MWLVVPKLAEQITLAAVTHGLLGQTEDNNLEIVELGDIATPEYRALVIHQIFEVLFAYFNNSYEICVQVVRAVI